MDDDDDDQYFTATFVHLGRAISKDKEVKSKIKYLSGLMHTPKIWTWVVMICGPTRYH